MTDDQRASDLEPMRDAIEILLEDNADRMQGVGVPAMGVRRRSEAALVVAY